MSPQKLEPHINVVVEEENTKAVLMQPQSQPAANHYPQQEVRTSIIVQPPIIQPARGIITTSSSEEAALNANLKEYLPKMRSGTLVTKFGRNGSPYKRFLYVADCKTIVAHRGGVRREPELVPHLCWSSQRGAAANGEPLCLLYLRAVVLGWDVSASVSQRRRSSLGKVLGVQGEELDERLCFSFVFTQRTVELCATTDVDFHMWVYGMNAVMKRNHQRAMLSK